MNWDTILAKASNPHYPAENFVRFVARNYYRVEDRSSIKFLDLGSGPGGNSWYLVREGFRVTALDGSEAALGSLRHRFEKERWPADFIEFVHADIGSWDYPKDAFDCVLDYNTLCHIEEPPFRAIQASLVDGGKFFCVTPAPDTWRGTLEGKGYCRAATSDEMQNLLSMFSDVKIHKTGYPCGDENITSWVIEATK